VIIGASYPFVPGMGEEAPAAIKGIAEISRKFPREFKAAAIIPAIEKAQDFAKTVSTSGLSRWGGGAAPSAIKGKLGKAWWKLEGWKKALKAKGDTTITVGTTGGKPSTDHWGILQAIQEPYAIAFEVQGAAAVVAKATEELIASLSLGFLPGGGLGFKVPTWAKVAGAAAAAIWIFGKAKR
jgi:hypothetical protein